MRPPSQNQSNFFSHFPNKGGGNQATISGHYSSIFSSLCEPEKKIDGWSQVQKILKLPQPRCQSVETLMSWGSYYKNSHYFDSMIDVYNIACFNTNHWSIMTNIFKINLGKNTIQQNTNVE